MLPTTTSFPASHMDTPQAVPQEPIPFLMCFAEATFPPVQESPLDANKSPHNAIIKLREKTPRIVVPTPVSALDIKSDSDFPPLGSATTPVKRSSARHSSSTSGRGSHHELAQIPEETQALAAQHATALLHVWRDTATPPTTFFTAVTTLLTAARMAPPTEDANATPFPMPGPLLKAYVRAVVRHLTPTLTSFPQTFNAHLPPDLHLEQKSQQPGNKPASARLSMNVGSDEMQPFPSGAFIPRRAMTLSHGDWTETAAVDDVIDSVERSDDPHNDTTPPVTRLRSNLEAAWDQFLVLHRKYRGEISTAFKAELNQMDAIRTMAALHPANVDLFAARTISLILRATRTPAHTPRRLRRLDERLSASPFPSTPTPMVSTMPMAAQNDTKRVTPRSKKSQVLPVQVQVVQATSTRNQMRSSLGNKSDAQSAVVLHRVPKAISQAFATEHSDATFFLDFLTSVDSSRLAVALAPRLATAALHAVGVASRAKCNEEFTDAVLESRLLVRLMGVCMHLANWPYSAYALSGVGTPASADVSTGLSDHACMLRVPAANAVASALFDIHTLVSGAATSGELLAIIAAVSTADAALRAAGVDPVARKTEWFARGVSTLAALRVEDSAGATLPLIRAIVGGCLQAQGVMPDDGISLATGIPRVIYRTRFAEVVGDARFLKLICPEIEALRKELINFFSDSPLRTSVIRRITPLAKGFAEVRIPSRVRAREDELEKESGESDKHVATSKNSKCRNDTNDEDDGDTPGGDDTLNVEENVRNDDGNNDDNDDDDDDDDNANHNDVQERLRKEFIARVDGRIRELVYIVAAARSQGTGEDVHDTFIKAVQLLYPETPHTVAAVAARVCDRRVKATRRIRQGHGRGESGKRPRQSSFPVQALEKGLDEAVLAPASKIIASNTTAMLMDDT